MPVVITAAFSAAVLLVPPITKAGPGPTAQPMSDPTLSMGDVLPNYGVVSVGPSANLTMNSGLINGKVLIGNGSNAMGSGGGAGADAPQSKKKSTK